MRINRNGHNLYTVSKIREQAHGRFRNTSWYNKEAIIDLHITIETNPPNLWYPGKLKRKER